MRLENKVAVVTGAAMGLGFAVAKLFFNEGASIAGIDLLDCDNNLYGAAFGKAENVFFYKSDITDRESVKNFVLLVEKKFGRVDILVNNAGINSMGNIEETSEEFFEKTMNVNVFGTFLVTKYMIPLIKRNENGGSIINVASNIGVIGMAGRIAYTTSKGAILNFTRSMALDYAPYNIRVNAVAPGAINTEMVKDFFKKLNDEEAKKKIYAMHALNRLAEPEEIAKTILFLASDDASYVTGAVFSVDGGYTCGK